MKKKIKKWRSNNRLYINEIKPTINSWIGHISHANSYNLLTTYINLLFKTKY